MARGGSPFRCNEPWTWWRSGSRRRGTSTGRTYSSQEHGGLEAIAYYWHFVDVVRIGLFATIYLIR
jgi:heme/copper-type cytochrome/quinol oxidase subunit 3